MICAPRRSGSEMCLRYQICWNEDAQSKNPDLCSKLHMKWLRRLGVCFSIFLNGFSSVCCILADTIKLRSVGKPHNIIFAPNRSVVGIEWTETTVVIETLKLCVSENIVRWIAECSHPGHLECKCSSRGVCAFTLWILQRATELPWCSTLRHKHLLYLSRDL